LHQLSPWEQYERPWAPKYMTDETRPIRQIPANQQEFQAAISELQDVTRKALISERSVAGRPKASKPLGQLFRGISMVAD
jgi:hypothetical protein